MRTELEQQPCSNSEFAVYGLPRPAQDMLDGGLEEELVDRIADDGKRSGVRDEAARRALRSLACHVDQGCCAHAIGRLASLAVCLAGPIAPEAGSSETVDQAICRLIETSLW